MLNIFKFIRGLKVQPKSGTAESTAAGEMEVLSSDNKLLYHNGTSSSPVVTEAHTATLTNKTIDANGTGNSISNLETADLAAGVLNTSTSLAGASNTQVPSALAVKTYVDNTAASGDAALQAHINDTTDAHQGSAIGNTPAGTITSTTVQAAINELDGDIQGHIGNGTGAHAASAISVTPSGNLGSTQVQAALVELQGDIDSLTTAGGTYVVGPASATDNALARFDLTTGKLIQNGVVTESDAGALAGITQLDVDNLRLDGNTISSTNTNGNIELVPNGTGLIDVQKIIRHRAPVRGDIVADTATGSNATLTAPTTPNIRLTNASLASIDAIPAGAAGQEITIINATGVTVTINNNTGGTAANRILTGTQAAISLADEASITLKYDDTETRWMIIGGTGSSTGGTKNYITNGQAITGTTGWVTYADAAGVMPVDGTGGSPNVTFAQNTTTPLSGTADFLFTKDAANRQGQGFSYDFTIDRADRGRVMPITFDYSSSANYVDGDMRVYIYDVTNSRMIEPDAVQIMASSQGHYLAQIQTSVDSVSYRLIGHISSTSALAYTLNFDNFAFGPKDAVKGSFISDWQSFTPTGTWTTNTTYFGKYRRVGDSIEAMVQITLAGAPTNTGLGVDLPSGLSIDSTKFPNGLARSVVGQLRLYDASADVGSSIGHLIGEVYAGTTSVFASVMDDAAASTHYTGSITPTVPVTLASGDTIWLIYKAPIVGWSSNQVASSDAGQRQVGFKAQSNGQAIASAGAVNLIFADLTNNSGFDTTASLNTSTGDYVVPESGIYHFTSGIRCSNLASANDFTFRINKNGSGVNQQFYSTPSATFIAFYLSATINCVKGDVITVSVTSGSDSSYNVDSGQSSYFAGFKNGSNQQIIASELVACSYNTNAAQSIGTSMTTVIFEDRVFDTHNAYNTSTGIYSVPVSGKYNLNSMVSIITTFASGTDEFDLALYKNGSQFLRLQNIVYITSNGARTRAGTILLDCVKGDTLEVRASTPTGAKNLTATGVDNVINIFKISGV